MTVPPDTIDHDINKHLVPKGSDNMSHDETTKQVSASVGSSPHPVLSTPFTMPGSNPVTSSHVT